MRALVDRLLSHEGLGAKVAHHRRIEGTSATYGEPRDPLSHELKQALESRGIARLYTHQAEALDAARAGRNVLAVTPTASGKTLVFALPVLEAVRRDPGTRALFLYPTKALAQDQLAGFRDLAMALGPFQVPRFEIYDGDTPPHVRKKIKADPPEVLITNPDMLHLGILARHQDWESFLRSLRFIVLDELHVYRGVFGAHVHHILRRLLRLCARVGARPQVLAASATVGNPAEFAELLVGEPFHAVERSGAPRAPREVLFVNPVMVSPYTAAVRVVAEAMAAGKRTIAFTKARRITELLHTWLVRQAPHLAAKVAPYRAGYLPEERRRIEARLFQGDLLGVLTTSALELGIDVGGLDVCVLVGYPGSRMSSWQRIGRVGRQDREALVVLIAMPDALDQYLMAHPEAFFDGAFERAVLDPWNPIVAGQHLVCAAAEDPLHDAEVGEEARARAVTAGLEGDHRLVRDAEGTRWYAFRRNPHRDVHPRSTGEPFAIVLAGSGRLLGSVDGMRVYHECHEGAVYLHGGRTFVVRTLDVEARRVEVEEATVDHYTTILGEKQTEILERLESRPCGAFTAGLGRLQVTVQIREYQKKRLLTGEPISVHPLACPPLTFETVGFWIEVPPGIPQDLTRRERHAMGGLHAAEHAMIGLFPLLAIADRGDVGGISYTAHPQVGGPAIFLYDGVPGGVGLAEQGFRGLEDLLGKTLAHVAACPCQEGCPACIQSPRCGNGNKPLDKTAATELLRMLLGELPLPQVDEAEPAPVPAPPERKRHGITRGIPIPSPRPAERILVFDLETQRSAAEVGGWHRADRMGLALGVVYDVGEGAYRTYREREVDRLLLDLVLADRVVGFNVKRFDLRVLSGYVPWDLSRIRFLDLLAEVRGRLGFRLSLKHLAEANLGESKSADGLTSLRWWREGRVDLIEAYCRKDVEVTHRLYALGAERGYLLYRDREGRALRLSVGWGSVV